MPLFGRRDPATPSSIPLPEARTEDGALSVLHRLERFVVDRLAHGETPVVVASADHRHRLRERLTDRHLDDGFLGLDAEQCLQRISTGGRADERRFEMLADGPLGGHLEAIALAVAEMLQVLHRHGDVPAAEHLEQVWSRYRDAEARAEAANPPPPVVAA